MKRSLFAATMLTVLAFSGPAFSHAHLEKAVPATGSTVTAAPREVVLVFSEPLERSFSSIEVLDSKGERFDAGPMQVSRETMRVPLKPLGAGTYKVNWKALSVDTHRTEGSFVFTVQP